jgi:replicative DNA helicase
MPQPPTTHVPPQNIEAEESVLGAMLVAEPALTRVIDEVKLNAADFYLDRHRAIFEAVHDLYAASKRGADAAQQDRGGGRQALRL